MAATQTPNYGWTQPAVGGDPTTWGNVLNDDLALIDAQVFSNESGVAPVGTIVMYAGPTAPANWLICNGASLATTTYNLLFAVCGYIYGGSGANFNLPNLGAQFPCGVGTNPQGVGVGLGEVTGTFSYNVPLPSHAHGVNDPEHAHGAYQNAHNHVIATGAHAHGIVTGSHAHSGVAVGLTTPGAIAGGAGGNLLMGNTSTAGNLGGNTDTAGNLGGNTDTQQPGVGVYAAATGVSIQAAGGSAAMNVVPPLVGVNFIIRYQ
jgi:microcystin-dependent protein